MPGSNHLFFLFATLVAAAPAPPVEERQLSGLPTLTGLSLPTESITGFSIPTGLSLPTDSSFGSGLNADEAVPTLTGLTGLTSISGFSLPTGLTSGSTGLTSGSTGLTGGSSEEDGLDNACQPVTLIFARGTTEVSNMGTVVGPGLTTDTESALSNKVNVQGVDYAADAAGIAEESTGTGGAGTQAMVADVTEALSKCPDTQIVLSGYSQGAMLVHNTMNNLDSSAAAKVVAAVTFGDPFVGEMPSSLASGTFKSFCATDDTVCDAGVASSPSAGGTTSQSTSGHLGYGSDTGTAATFIKSMVSV